MIWSTGLFLFTYLIQNTLYFELGYTPAATLIFILLLVSAFYGIMIAREFHKRHHNGMFSFGMVSLLILALLSLTPIHSFGVYLYILYAIIATSRLFKLIQDERKGMISVAPVVETPPIESD